MGISDVLTDPDSFFERRVEDPSWFVPIVLVLLTALLAAIAASPEAELAGEAASMVLENQGQEANQSVQNVISTGAKVVGIGWAFIETFGGWLLYGLVFYVIARFGFEGTGSFGNTLALTGWGYVPAVINQAISVAAAYAVFGGASLPEGSMAAQETLAELRSDPILLAASVVGLALLAWSGVIWTYAMSHLHDLSRRDAAITVGIPVAFVLIMRINGIV